METAEPGLYRAHPGARSTWPSGRPGSDIPPPCSPASPGTRSGGCSGSISTDASIHRHGAQLPRRPDRRARGRQPIQGLPHRTDDAGSRGCPPHRPLGGGSAVGEDVSGGEAPPVWPSHAQLVGQVGGLEILLLPEATVDLVVPFPRREGTAPVN